MENQSRRGEMRAPVRPFSILNSQFSIPFAAALLLVWAFPNAAWAAEAGVQMARSGRLEGVLFYLFSGAAIAAALMICIGRNVIRMAVCLFFLLGSVALLYFLLGANFLGAIQFIVYAGGTLILLVFGVMLTSQSPWLRLTIAPREAFMAAAVGLVIGVTLVSAVGATSWPTGEPEARGYAVSELGRSLLTTYLVPFEVISVLLLVVMIGAAYLARQEG